MAKTLKHFYLEPGQVKYLEDESIRTGKSQARIIRNLIDREKYRKLGINTPMVDIEEDNTANKIYHITEEIKFKPTAYNDECYLGWLYDADSSLKVTTLKRPVREPDEEFIQECKKKLNSKVVEIYREAWDKIDFEPF